MQQSIRLCIASDGHSPDDALRRELRDLHLHAGHEPDAPQRFVDPCVVSHRR